MLSLSLRVSILRSMLAEPRVDVGIPTRGAAPFLAEAIESVLAQTTSAWRLVVSENGAAGAASGIVRRFADDARIAYVANEIDVGPARNYTNLIRTGSAPYVALLHDDDRWEPTFLERRAEFLDQHPECGFVFSGWTIIDASGKKTGQSPPALEEGVYEPADFLPLLYRENLISAPSVLVRRAAYEAVGADYSDRVAFTDHEMWLRLASRFRVGYVRAWDAHYRLHAAQDSSQHRLQLGTRRLEVLDAVGDVAVAPRIRQRARAETLAYCALDAVERGDRPAALHYVAESMRTGRYGIGSGIAVRRVAAALGAIGLGRSGRRLLKHVRERRFRVHGAEDMVP